MKLVNRTARLPVYVFSTFDEIKKKLTFDGIDIVDLGIGDPDIPTPDFIIESMITHVRNPKHYNYPPYSGIDEFKQAVARYYKRKYGVQLDYEKEVAALIGSKEGIAHLFLALTDKDDYVLIPDPGYPVYNAGAVIAGCKVYRMHLNESNNYLPQIDNIYPEVAKKAKLMIVNYPNNPTGAVANSEFYRSTVEFGINNDIVIANDGAYMDICRNDYDPISLLQTPDAMKTCVEFGTLSKSYNMTGWRLGYIVGNRDIIKRLMVIKTNFDSGQFSAIQMASVDALNKGDGFIEFLNKTYEERRRLVVKLLHKKGLSVYDSKGAFYIWFKVPKGYKSQEFSSIILEKAGIIITPGDTFGMLGEGYCRISLTVEEKRLQEAMDRIEKIEF